MGTIRKRGDYQFQAQVRRTGYPEQSKTFETRRDAEKWVRSIERDMDTGEFIPRGEAARTTINDVCARYREEMLPRHKGWRQEDQRLRAIETKFGSFNLSAVTPAMVAGWREYSLQQRAFNRSRVGRNSLSSHYLERTTWTLHSTSWPSRPTGTT